MDAGRVLRTARAADEGQPAGAGRRADGRQAQGARHRAGPGLRHRASSTPTPPRACSAAMDGFDAAAEGREEAQDRQRLDRDAQGHGQLRHRLRDARRHRLRRPRRGSCRWTSPTRRPSTTATDKPLDAANRYVLHFDKGQTPPANVELVGLDVRPAGLLRAERDRPLQPRGVDAAQGQPRRLARHLSSRPSRRARTRRRTGCRRRPAGRSTWWCASSGRRKRCSTAATRCRRHVRIP